MKVLFTVGIYIYMEEKVFIVELDMEIAIDPQTGAVTKLLRGSRLRDSGVTKPRLPRHKQETQFCKFYVGNFCE